MGSDWHILIYEVEDRLALTATAGAGFYEVTGSEHTAVIAVRPGHVTAATVIEKPGEPVDTAWSLLPVRRLMLRVGERGSLIPSAGDEAVDLGSFGLGVVERIVEVAMCDPLHRWRR